MKVKCKNCKRIFDVADRASPTARPGSVAQIRYCSIECKRSAQNKRHYDRNKRKRRRGTDGVID